jgi:hypothetical protein
MTMTKKLGTIVFAVAMTFLVAGPAVAQAPDLAAKIAAAKTAADHEALAAEYSKEATAAQEEASRHDKMAASYRGAGTAGQRMQEHCSVIAKNYRAQAKELEALAAAHRAEAKKLGK